MRHIIKLTLLFIILINIIACSYFNNWMAVAAWVNYLIFATITYIQEETLTNN